MSATRTERRRKQRQWAYEAGRRALSNRPTIAATMDHRGQRAVYVTFEPDPAWPEAITQAWTERYRATSSGSCVCGARAVFSPEPGETIVGTMEHEPECLVSDDRFIEAVGRWALGRAS